MADPMMSPREFRPMLIWAASAAVLLGACDGGEGTLDSTLALETIASPALSQVTATEPRQRQSAEISGSRNTAIVEAAARVAPAVVSVNVIRTEQVQTRSFFDPFPMPRTRRSRGLGSGFIVSDDGVILTNDHVVRDSERIMVTLPDGRDFEAELLGSDQLTDVAVLRIQGDDLPVAPVGTSEGLLIGEWSLAIGNPFGNLFSNSEPSVTAGVISGTGRHIIPDDEDRVVYLGMIQTDASINPGNSGGPLVNSVGEVIGVNSSIFSRSGGSEGLGFAIPIDRAISVANELITSGEVQRAWLGFEVDPGEEDIWGRTHGVAVSSVSPSSPAARAQISPGDRVVTANGRALRTLLDFESLMLDLEEGESIALGIEGRQEPVTLVSEALPSVAADRVTALEQMDLITVTPSIRAERSLSYETGALIVDIERDLESRIGIRAGDVILQIDRRRIESAEQAAEVLRRASGSVAVYIERNGEVIVRRLLFRGTGG
jgi:serine protease Do